jgi:hypothetical protein
LNIYLSTIQKKKVSPRAHAPIFSKKDAKKRGGNIEDWNTFISVYQRITTLQREEPEPELKNENGVVHE